MPQNNERLDVIIKVKDTASKNLRKINRGFKAFQTRLKNLPRSIFNLRNALIGLGLGLTAKSFIQAASTAEQFRTRLNVLLGSVEEGSRLFKNMAEFAGKVSFSYEEIMASATNLTGVMREGVDEVSAWMPLIGDLAAATGMTVQETTGQVIRMYSAGAAAADMFRERGVLAMLGFQAKVQYSAQQTRDMLMKAWKDPSSQFAGAATELGKTWAGMLSMVSDRWFQFRTLVMDQGLFDYIKALLSTFLDFIQELQTTGRLDKWANETSKAVIMALGKMIKGFAAVLEVINFVRRAFEGIKFAINGLLAVWSFAWGKILAGVSTVADFLGMDGLAGAIKSVSDELIAVSDVAVAEMDKAAIKMVELADKQGQAWDGVSGFIDGVTVKMKEFGKTSDKVREKMKLIDPAEVKKQQALLASSVLQFKEKSQTALLVIDIAYKNGLISLNDYFGQRKAIMEAAFHEEIRLLEARAAKEIDPSKQIAAQDKIFKARQAYNRAILEIDQERVEKQEDMNEKSLNRQKIMEDLRLRAGDERGGNLSALFAKELSEMDFRHQEEIQKLTELNAAKSDINDAYRLQEQEKNKLMADQERRLMEYRLQVAADVAGGLSEIFDSMYELGGKKRKEFFYLAKAAALAEAIINTAQAVTKALAQGGVWGIGMAAVIGAKGAISIAKITSQSLAEGGPVAGVSPSSTADDKLIAATSGEFMQPVGAVKHYGLGVMEAIRRQAIPKDLLSGFKIPSPNRPAFGFAEGGVVGKSSGGQGINLEANIFNIKDEQEFERTLASAKGKNSVINFMGQNSRTIRKVLGI